MDINNHCCHWDSNYIDAFDKVYNLKGTVYTLVDNFQKEILYKISCSPGLTNSYYGVWNTCIKKYKTEVDAQSTFSMEKKETKIKEKSLKTT